LDAWAKAQAYLRGNGKGNSKGNGKGRSRGNGKGNGRSRSLRDDSQKDNDKG